MKKFAFIMMSIILGLFVLSGCDMLSSGRSEGAGSEDHEPTPLEKVTEKYGRVGEATAIEREIEIVRGALTQYESLKRYEKQDGAYAVSGTERTLNGLDGETAYTERAISETLPAGAFEVKLNLSSVYFQDFEIENGTLQAVVWNGNAEAVFGIREDLPAPIYNLALTMETDETHVTRIEIAYGTTNNSTVTICIKFTY